MGVFMRRAFTTILVIILFYSLPALSSVVINEVFYDPSGIDTGFEFLELYNNGTSAVDLTGWQVQYGGTTFAYATWDFPAGTSIAAGDYLLVGGDSVQTFFEVIPDVIAAFAFQNGSSSGTGPTDGVRIYNPAGPYYDTILYDAPNTNNLPGDDATPGAQLCPDVVSGHSLERVTVGVDNNLASDWADRTSPTPHRSSTGMAPEISNAMNYPVMVGSFSNVQIVADIIDPDGTVATATAHYSTNGVDWSTVAMTHVIANRWFGTLPQQTAGTIVDYYVSAVDNSGLTAVAPAGAPVNFYSYTVSDTLTLSANISDVRQQDENGYPTNLNGFYVIEGYVTTTNQFGLAGPASIQDETGGMAIYDALNFNWANIQIGDYVRVYGWMGFYAGLTEFVDSPTGTPDPQVYVIGASAPVTPQIITVSQFGEAYESELVKLENCTFLSSGSFIPGSSGANYWVLCNGDSAQIRIDESTNIGGQPIPTGTVSIVGIFSQYDNTSPYTSGYQILPRFYSDIITTGDQPPFIGNITQSPLMVTPASQVTITAEMYDDIQLVNHNILWGTSGSFTSYLMYDDGLHGDGAANDSLFGAFIPPQVAGTTIQYYLEATDNIGQVTYNPAGGSSTPASYTVTTGATFTPISTVREVDANLYPTHFGQLYSVKGLVTCANQLGTSGAAYLQDGTGGVAFYDGLVTSSGIAIGDSIELTAYVDFYAGLIELADDPANPSNDPVLTIINSGNTVTPLAIVPSGLNETNEGKLVKVIGAVFVETGNFASAQSAHAVVGTDTFVVYIDNSTNLVGSSIPTGAQDIVGCVGQYDNSSPYTSGFQLIPRFTADLTASTPITPIADVKVNDGSGYPVNINQEYTIMGVITAGSQFSSLTGSGPAYMEDASGGIALYDAPVTMFGNIGDYVRITGWVGFSNGLTEIVDHPTTSIAPTVEVISTGMTVTPTTITYSQIGEAAEGKLVKIENCHFTATGNFGTSSTNYYVHVGADSFQVRIIGATNIAGTPIPTGQVNITGCLGQYDTSSPYFSGYQLQPRFLTDIEPYIPSTPIQDLRISITGSDVRLDWTIASGNPQYHIYHKTAPYGTATLLGNTANNYYVINGGASGSGFYYVTYGD